MLGSDEMAKESIKAKHLVIAKSCTMRGHNSQYNGTTTTITILIDLYFLLHNEWMPFFVNICRGMRSSIEPCLVQKNMELQLGQLTSNISRRPKGSLPSNTKTLHQARGDLFLKDILAKKRRINDFETIALMQATSDVFKNGVPQKMTNPGSFMVSCSIGGMDLGCAV
ncbi:uncharacterized protein E5676_scaffold157G00070 [Cucumis melo var. makuwa]|uniref:Uncharacterized protein n=1 Tax=Cucumis melo var. makuwa TaxID=1194695 RepID=A0A5D3C7E5_CUCMM|nr:uncharacterized protein E6C27_scaffold455G00070 [Cucumis melo var. makuwa]TYK06236.1 uncharacterized protein E5676_scaffold157G00070 [Cucumis melo var. makuwa]